MNQGTVPKSDDAALQNAASHEGSSDKEQASDESRIVVPRGRKLLPSEETLLELGKDLVKDSVTQALEFHKTMLGLTATFATLMASSFAILTLGSKDQPLDSFQRASLVVPVLLMLVSTICFALGYYPRRVKLRLQDLTTIKKARTRLLRPRGFWAVCGVLFFILSIVSLLVGIVSFNLS